MIGYLFLIISLLLYLRKKKAWSLALFMLFASRGMFLFPDYVIGTHNQLLTCLYLAVILFYSLFIEKEEIGDYPKSFRWCYILLILFLICSFISTYVNWNCFHPLLLGSFFIITIWFIIRKLTHEEILLFINILFWITVVHAILYDIQVIGDIKILPYQRVEIHIESTTGLSRYFNFPIFAGFYFLLLCLCPQILFIKKKVLFLLLLLFTIFLTQGRVLIVSILLFTLVGLLLQKRVGKLSKYAIIGLILVYPFFDTALNRFEKSGETSNDINDVLSLGFVNAGLYGYYPSGTFSYRLAWIVERGIYMLDAPFCTQIFGLGMFSDSDQQTSAYNFSLGISNEDGIKAQLTTPDISYGNLITRYGFIGGLIYLSFWIILCYLFFKKRDESPINLAIFIYIVFLFVESFSGDRITNQCYLIIPLMFLNLAYNKND